jgi:uncharacterized protein YbaR (Trm112 family)
MKIDLASLKGSAILDLVKEGHIFLCPVCRNQLITIPEQLAPEVRPLGVTCPISQRHYIIYGDAADRLQEARRRMALIATEMNKKDA